MNSDSEYLVDLLGRAYSILMAYGVQNSQNMDRVLLMDEIKLAIELHSTTESETDKGTGGSK